MTTRYSSGRTGVSAVTLIIFVVLTLIAVMVAFIFYTSKAKLQWQLNTTRADSDVLDKKAQAILTQKGEVESYLENKKTAEDVKKFFEDMQLPQGLTAIPKNFRTINDELDLSTARLTRLVTDLQLELKQAGIDADGAEAARDKVKEQFATRVQKKNEELAEFDKYLAEELKKKEDLLAQLTTEEKDWTNKFNNVRDEWEAKKKTLLDKTEQVKQKNAVDRRNLRVLPPVPTIPPANGKVIKADWQTRKAEISLGTHDHVYPGLVFDVFFINAKGQRQIKAKLEIYRVGELSSLANITESAKENPVVTGDLVQAPMLSGVYKKKFVIAGFIPPETSFTNDKLAALIRLNGGEVQPAVNLFTDVLILGETGGAGVAKVEEAKLAAEAATAVQQGVAEAETARELSVPVVDYHDFIQAITR